MLKWLCGLCFNATLVLALACSAQAAEVIHQFDSAVQLAKDGTLTVTETLNVRAEGREIKRGIFRDFPMTFTDAGGREREVDFQLLGVTRDGKYEPHFTERKQRFLRIYAGAKDVFVTPGDHVYVIQYTTGRQVRWFDGKPELNWNVTGNFWNFPIAAVTYRLKLVDGARPLRFTAFTGVRGAKGKEWQGGDRQCRRADGCDHAAACAQRGPHRRCRVAGHGGRSDQPAASLLVFSVRQPPLDTRRRRFRAGFDLLPGGLARGRPRSQTRHHHSAVSSAAGRIAGACQLHRQLGLLAAKSGAPSPRPRCRWPCADSSISTTMAPNSC